ncbi:unnamed protein product [Parnassius apollo]|uniref:(apollo) hypothetical protein n=1 Tax=Parnassius apollo TaxID=110799 RepID=A0A8S3XMK4_PARAO|nr:unnamed protein product [Parnassius apollo]
MSDDNEDNLPNPISEVGSVLIQTQNENVDSDGWRAMFEKQNANMRALFEDLQAPKINNHVNLPEFDPDKTDTDQRWWFATADLCFAENPLHGVQLVLAVRKALKGTASTWLSQIAYQGISWSEFKVLFTTRFISTETLAATLITLSSDKPSEKETLVAYATRLMTSLTNR